jgi:hypothetical protein
VILTVLLFRFSAVFFFVILVFYLDVFFEDATKNSNRVAIDSQDRKRSDEWPEE